MIAALLLLLAQDVPAPPPAKEEVEEIVIQATFGTTTMLFDKGADNKLRNCRIMVSSGSQRRDTNACHATPVCYAKTAALVTECIELTAIEPASLSAPRTGLSTVAPSILTLPKLVQPVPAVWPGALGPALTADKPASDKQRIPKLPPLPENPSGGPVIRITNAQDQ